MADLKISQLTGASTPLTGTETLPLVQSGSTKKVAVSDLTTGRSVSMSAVTATATGLVGNVAQQGIFDVGISGATSSQYLTGGVGNNAATGIFKIGSGSNRGASVQGYRAASSNIHNLDLYSYNSADVHVMRMDSNGDAKVMIGNFVPATAAKGVNFTANTPAAGMTSQLLNWYEEGTFTPTIIGTSTAGTGTYNAQGGRYTRIGRVVTFQLYVDWSAHTGTGNMEVAGLPFASNTSGDLYSAVAIRANNIALTAGYYLQALVLNNSTQVRLGQYPTGGGANLAVPLDTAGSFVLSGQYVV